MAAEASGSTGSPETAGQPAAETPDFNGDGYADLAVGVWEDLGSIESAGAVHVLYGSAGGLSSAGNQIGHQDTPGIREVARASDFAGFALA